MKKDPWGCVSMLVLQPETASHTMILQRGKLTELGFYNACFPEKYLFYVDVQDHFLNPFNEFFNRFSNYCNCFMLKEWRAEGH